LRITERQLALTKLITVATFALPAVVFLLIPSMVFLLIPPMDDPPSEYTARAALATFLFLLPGLAFPTSVACHVWAIFHPKDHPFVQTLKSDIVFVLYCLVGGPPWLVAFYLTMVRWGT